MSHRSPAARRAAHGGALALSAVLGLLAGQRVDAEPWIALQTGYHCAQCHLNPTGGGLRTAFGDAYAQTALPAQRLETGTDLWTGDLTRLLRVGGDLRFQASANQVPHAATVSQFQLDQVRAYAAISIVPERLTAYADELVAPGGALNREAWMLYGPASHAWYVKAGQMYLPFGWRLQDQSAFVRRSSGINMTTPDRGVEFGWLKGAWDAQLAASNGTAGGPVSDSRKQYAAQLSWVRQGWRIGMAANFNDKQLGSRAAYGAFAGMRAGPLVLLAEADWIRDRSLDVARGGRTSLATLLEADWLIRQGHNLKITQEFLDPDRRLRHNGQTRWSVLYELTPVQFVQLRAGVRDSAGIAQIPTDNARLYFVELHGFF